MTTIDLTLQDFEQTVSGGRIVLIDFWAAWCGPCRMFAPIFEQASERHPDIVFAKVDTEAEQQLSAMAGITSIPTLMVFRDGIGIHSRAGVLPAAALDALIERVRALDMAAVEAEINAAVAVAVEQAAKRAGRDGRALSDEVRGEPRAGTAGRSARSGS